jgi:predicted GIY-YIG superfamily endonuclease
MEKEIKDAMGITGTDIWTFYMLTNLDCKATYAGVTNNPERRLRQHNGEISGGSRWCKKRGGRWALGLTVGAFEKKQALRFEYAFKRGIPGLIPRGARNRLERLSELMKEDPWNILDLKLSFHDDGSLAKILTRFEFASNRKRSIRSLSPLIVGCQTNMRTQGDIVPNTTPVRK